MEDLTREKVMAYEACDHSSSIKNNKSQMCNSSIRSHKLPQVPANGMIATILPCIRLDPDGGQIVEAEAWQHMSVTDHMRLDPLNTNKLLLQGSDDPLISHGASNDPHDEDQDYPFKTLLARRTEEQQTMQHGTCSTLTKQQLKANLMNARKSHRPIPVQEVAVATQRVPRQGKSKKRPTSNAGAVKLRFHHQALPAEYAAHYEATQRRHLSSTRTAPSAAPAVKVTHPPQSQSHENVRSWLKKIAEIQRSAERQQQEQELCKDLRSEQPSESIRVVATQPLQSVVEVSSPKRGAIKYADLPYMGEITLDNYKPRRGRKPKKADICHLIYKNYGTIVPTNVPATSAQHGPLLESKLPAGGSASILPHRIGPSPSAAAVPLEEPLNLCLRDQSSDRYSISSGDSDKPSTGTNAATSTTECGSYSHRATPLPNATGSMNPISIKFARENEVSVSEKLLLQPVGLIHQKFMGNCHLGVQVETIEKDNQLSLKIPIPSGFFDTITTITTSPNKREPLELSIDTVTPPVMRKRKRSAIFIPPIPAEYNGSPSTEVSICKFKFTGGAKPMLEEKKMLSVDAEGNYRYYNGTGDRNLRGYEFISREQQQQQQQQQQYQTSASSSTSNDKLYIDIPPPSTDLSLELLHIPPESPTSSIFLPSSLVPVASQSPSNYSSSHSPMQHAALQSEDCNKQMEPPEQLSRSLASPRQVTTSAAKRGRSSRRSKQREKLEKTFKEKGFLIQTQQLQSAEGATYCKFRQLKKFTRYLFRNWKDHIPESDICKHHHGKDVVARDQHNVLENILVGQIGLGVDNLATMQATAKQVT
ncbi:uncharacterized protein LOC6583570 [Drosophila mojavensis]|nr:uncharacterized protein LOC6583570 [Drosophila mojavensis]XP_015018414.1 uncharacterized protein LOC6583570 [Drosophila mojavensis]XP_032586787.1 uncharacterized protein LOC6583570 [Drosophila mojavensis]XP_032586788.1 uncharacterized protein LOC6583570 [Drosophila mojavensis]EDW19712.1 uncharacterized protein Dmoj_GI11365, isoform A [Drosophila mojavensis]KRG06762.1 uncharacterized protein Dmoj_GI11365, isoform C [Drosophila mojavensis]